MNAIDFMNNKLYEKDPGCIEDKSTHPKFILIKPDGVILCSDISNDGKKFSAFDETFICSNHIDYMKKLVDGYFSSDLELVQAARVGNLYGSIKKLVEDGNILFNNSTTYVGPVYYLHGIHGALFLPNNVTDMQKDSLKEINDYIKYFREIEVKEGQSLNYSKNIYIESGDTAIKNYLSRSSEKGYTKS